MSGPCWKPYKEFCTGVSCYTHVRFTRFQIYASWENNIKKMFDLQRIPRYMQFSAGCTRENCSIYDA